MNLKESISKLQHEQWSGWMQYLFSKCTFLQEGCAVIPAWAVERWQRQMRTPYDALSNEERDSDREEADKILSLPIEGVEIKEKCSHYEYICVSNCGDCEYLSGSPSDRECVIEGIIRRPATLQEVVDLARGGRAA